MQIILKEKENSSLCLFDTRSNTFFSNGCVKNENSSILSLANEIVSKSPESIIELADNYLYEGDYGYTCAMIARTYLKMNPDIREKMLEKIKKKKDKKTQFKEKRGRKSKSSSHERKPKIEAKSKPVISPSGEVKRGRGRPRKNP